MPNVGNERLGYLLLLAGFVAAVGLDPWSLSETNPEALLGSTRMAARHAQAVVLAMGFLQIAVARLLREHTLSLWLRQLAGPVLGIGTLIYAGGYVGMIHWPAFAWIICLGAAVQLVGFALLACAAWRTSAPVEVAVVIGVFLFGMAIDLVSGLYAVDASRFLPVSLGPEDGVQQRMLRLARVAATALSLVTLLFYDLLPAQRGTSWVRWGRLGMLVGTVGMPTVLVAACLVRRELKYLLPIPALAMTGSVVIGLLEARQNATRLETCGWLLIGASMNIGLLVGLYAFDGPVPTPAFVGPYNAFVRRLSRLGHAYAIVLGLLAILLGRQGVGRWSEWLLLIGSGVTLLAIAGVTLPGVPILLLAAGPGLIVLALLAAGPAGSASGKSACVLPEKGA